MTWTVLPPGVDSVCGHCHAVIAGDKPIALVTARQLLRCESCAGEMGFVVDAQAIDRERLRLESERLARPPAPPATYGPRVPRPRPMLPFSEIGAVAFDSKAAAVGRDD